MLKFFLFSALLHFVFFALFAASPKLREDAPLSSEIRIQLRTETRPISDDTPPAQALNSTESLPLPTSSPVNTLISQDDAALQEAPVMHEAGGGPFTRHLRRAQQSAPLRERFAVNCESNAQRDDCRPRGAPHAQDVYP